jgi:hypothetical protein
MEGADNVTTSLGPAAILSKLNLALTALGDALATPALEPLVRAEADLAAAVELLRQLPTTPPPHTHATVRAEIARVGVALERCRRLGSSLQCVVHAGLVAQGRESSYARQGAGAVEAPDGAFEARG